MTTTAISVPASRPARNTPTVNIPLRAEIDLGTAWQNYPVSRAPYALNRLLSDELARVRDDLESQRDRSSTLFTFVWVEGFCLIVLCFIVAMYVFKGSL